MNYIDYIVTAKKNNKICDHLNNEVRFEDVYKNCLSSIKEPTFKKVLEEFKLKGKYVREDIFKEVENGNLKKSFIMIILWGGLNFKNIKRAISEIDGIEEKLKRTYDLLNGNSFKGILRNEAKAFDDLFDGENHIGGIGVSFLTKILYFFDLQKKCLIYDTWGRLEHCALVASRNEEMDRYYTLKKKRSKIKWKKSTSISERNLYFEYIIRINNVANNINTPPDVLEEYLFGKPWKKKETNNDRDNPRLFLYCFLSDLIDRRTKLCKDGISLKQPRWRNDKILDWSQIMLDGIPTILFIGCDTKHQYYCEINFMEKRDVDIGLLTDTRQLFDTFTPNGYHWEKSNKQYRYVMFGEGEDNLNRAKQLKTEILTVFPPIK